MLLRSKMNCYYVLLKDLELQDWVKINEIDDQLRTYSVNCDSPFHELQLFDADLSELAVGVKGKGLFVVCKQNRNTFSGHSIDGSTILERKITYDFSFMNSFSFCNFIRTDEYTCEYIIPPADVNNCLYDSKWATLPVRKYTKSVNGVMVVCKWCELPKFVKLVNKEAVVVLSGIKLYVFDKKKNVLTAAKGSIKDDGGFSERVCNINVQSEFGRLVRSCVRIKPQEGFECVLTKKNYVYPQPLRVVYDPDVRDSVATVDKVIKLSDKGKWNMENKPFDWMSIPSSNRPLLINKTMFKQTFKVGDKVKFNVKVMQHTEYEVDMEIYLELAHEETDGKLDRYDYYYDKCYDSPRTVFREMLNTKTRAFWDNDPKNKLHLSGDEDVEFNSSYLVFRVHDKVFDTKYGREMRCMIFDLTRREKGMKCEDVQKYDKKMEVDRNCMSRMLYFYANRSMSRLSTTSGSVKCEKGMIDIRHNLLCPEKNVSINNRHFGPNEPAMITNVEINMDALELGSWKDTFECTKPNDRSTLIVGSFKRLFKPKNYPDTLSKCSISPEMMLYKKSGDVGIYGHDYTTLQKCSWKGTFQSENKDRKFDDKGWNEEESRTGGYPWCGMPAAIFPSNFEIGNRTCQAGEFFENHLHTEVPHNGIPGDWSQGVCGFFLENSHPIECSLHQGGLRKWTRTEHEMPTLPIRLYRSDKYEVHSTIHPWGNVKKKRGRRDQTCAIRGCSRATQRSILSKKRFP